MAYRVLRLSYEGAVTNDKQECAETRVTVIHAPHGVNATMRVGSTTADAAPLTEGATFTKEGNEPLYFSTTGETQLVLFVSSDSDSLAHAGAGTLSIRTDDGERREVSHASPLPVEVMASNLAVTWDGLYVRGLRSSEAPGSSTPCALAVVQGMKDGLVDGGEGESYVVQRSNGHAICYPATAILAVTDTPVIRNPTWQQGWVVVECLTGAAGGNVSAEVFACLDDAGRAPLLHGGPLSANVGGSRWIGLNRVPPMLFVRLTPSAIGVPFTVRVTLVGVR